MTNAEKSPKIPHGGFARRSLMRKRPLNIFRDRRVVLILACLALLGLFLLAISLESLEFSPGDVFRFEKTNSLSPFLKILSFDRIFMAILIILLVSAVIASVYVLSKKELRGMFLRRMLQMIILGAIFLVLVIFSGGGEEAQATPTPTPITAPTAIEVPQFLDDEMLPEAEELPPLVEPPSWLNYLISLAVVLAVGAVAWTLWTRNKKPDLRELADIAMAASDDIEAGLDIEDVIMRCYVHMMSVVKKRRGLNRKEAMTPTEFAYWLEGAGLPGGPLHKLTRLFERVRYGAYLSSKEEAREAADCLREIALFCGDGHS